MTIAALILAAAFFTVLLLILTWRSRYNRRVVTTTRLAVLAIPPGVRQSETKSRTLAVSRERYPELLVFDSLYWEHDRETIEALIGLYESR